MRLPQKARGKYPTAEQFNQLLDVVRSLTQIRVGPGLALSITPSGVLISLTQKSVKAITYEDTTGELRYELHDGTSILVATAVDCPET